MEEILLKLDEEIQNVLQMIDSPLEWYYGGMSKLALVARYEGLLFAKDLILKHMNNRVE